jgi:hypothetical protein
LLVLELLGLGGVVEGHPLLISADVMSAGKSAAIDVLDYTVV